MKRFFVFLFLLCFLAGLNLTMAAQTESVPVGDEIYSWVYDFIDQLYLRGYLREIHLGSKPYYRGEVASLILSLDEKKIRFNPVELWLIQELKKEFSSEIENLKKDGEDGKELKFGLDFLEKAQIQKAKRSDLLERGFPFLGAQWGKNFSVFLRYDINESLAKDPTYEGKIWKGFAGEAEQAYFAFKFPYFKLILGRDRLSWGQSKISSLILSDGSPCLDMIKIQGGWGFFQGTAFTAFLEPMAVEGKIIKRYLSGHRLSFKIYPWAELGLSETIIYGGENRGLEPYYLNPLLWYHGAQLNHNRDDNTFFCFDFNLSPKENILFYGEFLIDDFQIEKSSPSDKEPDELGFVLGFSLADFFGLSGSELNLEYDRIANRTYNQQNEQNRYLHKKRLLGSRLGPDSDCFKTSIRSWIKKGLEAKIEYSFSRHGEGSIFSFWDRPWLFDPNYKEKFPTGVVEKTKDFSFGLGYRYNSHLKANLNLGYTKVFNKENITEDDEDFFKLTVNFQYQFIKR